MKTEQKNKIGEILSANFDIKNAEISTLEGYESENYKVETADGKFVLKLYENKLNLQDILTAESLLLQELSNFKPNSFSSPVKNVDDEFLTESNYKYVHLLSFVEGEFLAEVKNRIPN